MFPPNLNCMELLRAVCVVGGVKHEMETRRVWDPFPALPPTGCLWAIIQLSVPCFPTYKIGVTIFTSFRKHVMIFS